MKLIKSVFFRYFIVGLITIGFVYWGYRISNPKAPASAVLPVYGPPGEDGKGHFISDFSFVDQSGKTITQDDFKGKIYVADFFFTKCEGICPKMSDQMERVYGKYSDDYRVRFISHTVKPEEDSIPVLAAYAKEHGADPGIWHFVTGTKKDLYSMARESYLVTVSEGNGGPEDFVHTQFFALVDPERRIRGYYDGTDSTDVNKLMADIENLLKTY